jgi:hypothetical protein
VLLALRLQQQLLLLPTGVGVTAAMTSAGALCCCFAAAMRIQQPVSLHSV